ARDGGTAYLLPQVANPTVLHTMLAGSDLLVSTHGLGVLVLDGFPAAAAAPTPPHLVLADGTSLSAGDVLARPGDSIGLGGACQPTAGLAAALAPVVPASGDVSGPGVPAADPSGQDGGRFDSVFSASLF